MTRLWHLYDRAESWLATHGMAIAVAIFVALAILTVVAMAAAGPEHVRFDEP